MPGRDATPPTPVRSALTGERLADLHGRGARSNRDSRFCATVHEPDADYLEHERVSSAPEASGDAAPEPRAARIPTLLLHEQARSIISRNDSPDIPFDQSVNPYRGCEHGCVYCYARPSHAYLGLSPGLDFETRIFAKTNAAELLERELRRPGYQPALIALGANTDPYQPAEKELGLTRAVLQTLAAFGHPVGITTKSALVLRDLDVLAPMAQRGLVRVWISIATLDTELARTLEPRANSPQRRLEAIRTLAQAGIPTGVFAAPVIPALTDPSLEAVLEAAAQAGATHAGYVLLRLPRELRDLFVEWLQAHYPLRAAHVMSVLRQMRDGADYESGFGTRMTGGGIFAQLLRQRFVVARRRLGLSGEREPLALGHFRVPEAPGAQQSLF